MPASMVFTVTAKNCAREGAFGELALVFFAERCIDSPLLTTIGTPTGVALLTVSAGAPSLVVALMFSAFVGLAEVCSDTNLVAFDF